MSNPARWPATICDAPRLPGSRSPRSRDPSTKSARPLSIGSSTAGIISGRSLPSPSMKSTIVLVGDSAASPESMACP